MKLMIVHKPLHPRGKIDFTCQEKKGYKDSSSLHRLEESMKKSKESRKQQLKQKNKNLEAKKKGRKAKSTSKSNDN